MVELSIIILSYNTNDLLKSCLDSLFTHLPKNTEVIVVDNASTDQSAAMVKKNFPNISLIENAKNVGFASGINIGVGKARGKYVLLLNSDAMVQDDSLTDMIAFAEKTPDAAVVGGMFVNKDGTIQRSFGKFYTPIAVTRMLIFGDKAELSGHAISRPPKSG